MAAAEPPPVTVPRGRHAPPLEVRLGLQRRRLLAAAATIFRQLGYAHASAEAIARAAGMSKATFYEHFANKEDCILALFDEAAAEIKHAMASASDAGGYATYEERVAANIRAFLETLARSPDAAYTLLVGIIGVGPRAAERRDAILESFADSLHRDNARTAPTFGAPTFASRDDAFAIIGAIVELVSRSLRTGEPTDVLGLEPVIARLMLGALDRA